MMSCFPCASVLPEVRLLKDCYPPSKGLIASGPEYRPLSQDLSKLTYACSNRPSRLAKVGDELERLVQKDATKSSGGYAKSRA